MFGNGVRNPVTGLWQALTCFYCYRSFATNYKKFYKTQEKLAHALGLDTELFEFFLGLREELWVKCREFDPAYLTKFRMDWNAAEAKVNLYVLSKLRMKVKKGDDEMVPFYEYPSDIDAKTGQPMGDPYTNGKGHKVIKYKDGLTYVLVPVLQRMRISRADIIDSVLKKDVADNTLDLSPEEIKIDKSLCSKNIHCKRRLAKR